MPKQPPWEIRVGRKSEVLAEIQVPFHKMGEKDIAAFLRALVVRYRTDRPEDMVSFYVNKRRGNPCRLPFADIKPAYQLEQSRVGYFCGDWECYAFAMHEIDETTATAMLKTLRQSLKGSC